MSFSIYKQVENNKNICIGDNIKSSPIYGRKFTVGFNKDLEVNKNLIFNNEGKLFNCVANETPKIYYSTDWKDGATTVLATKWKEFTENDIIKTFASANGNYKPIVATDAWTQKFPSSGISIEIPISFRAYPESMNDTSDYFQILRRLIAVTTPSKFKFSSTIKNVGTAIDQAERMGYSIGTIISDIKKNITSFQEEIKTGYAGNTFDLTKEALNKIIDNMLTNGEINDAADYGEYSSLKNIAGDIKKIIGILENLNGISGYGCPVFTLSCGDFIKDDYYKWAIKSWSFKPAVEVTKTVRNSKSVLCPIYIDFNCTFKTIEKIGTTEFAQIFHL